MRPIVLVIAALSIFSSGSITADAAEPYIQLKDSTILRGCEYQIINSLRTVVVYCGGSETRVLFTDVLRIVDSTGTDITSAVISLPKQRDPDDSLPTRSFIKLTDGTILQGCDYNTDERFKTIDIICGEKKTTVSFTEVARIVDDAGRDVTEKYLGDYYRPRETAQEGEVKAWSEIDGRETHVRRSRPFGAGFAAQGFYRFHFDNYFDGINHGIGFGGDVVLTIDNHQALRLGLSQGSFGTEPRLSPGVRVVSNDLSYNVTQFFVAFQYYDWPRWRTNGTFMWYLYSGIGVTWESFGGELMVYNSLQDEFALISGGGSESRFTMTGGWGIVSMLSSWLGLDVSGNLDILYVKAPDFDAVNPVVFDLRIGLIAIIRNTE